MELIEKIKQAISDNISADEDSVRYASLNILEIVKNEIKDFDRWRSENDWNLRLEILHPTDLYIGGKYNDQLNFDELYQKFQN